jgi:methionine--tRNA ligase beta chain
MENKISIDDFKKTEIKIGKILSAEKTEGSDKLLKLMVDFGEETPRQIISGIALYFPDTAALVGKKCAFCTNLQPRVIRGFASDGMILAASGQNGDGDFFSLLEVPPNVAPGAAVH